MTFRLVPIMFDDNRDLFKFRYLFFWPSNPLTDTTIWCNKKSCCKKLLIKLRNETSTCSIFLAFLEGFKCFFILLQMKARHTLSVVSFKFCRIQFSGFLSIAFGFSIAFKFQQSMGPICVQINQSWTRKRFNTFSVPLEFKKASN